MARKGRGPAVAVTHARAAGSPQRRHLLYRLISVSGLDTSVIVLSRVLLFISPGVQCDLTQATSKAMEVKRLEKYAGKSKRNGKASRQAIDGHMAQKALLLARGVNSGLVRAGRGLCLTAKKDFNRLRTHERQ